MTSPWPYRQMRSLPRLPFPGNKATHSSFYKEGSCSTPDIMLSNSDEISNSDVIKQLGAIATQYPSLFEDYIVENTRSDTISRWLTRKKFFLQNVGSDLNFDGKASRSLGDSTGPSDDLNNSKETLGSDDTAWLYLSDKVDSGKYLAPLYASSAQLRQATLSSGFNFYAVGGTGESLHLYNPDLPQWRHDPLPMLRSNITPCYVIGTKSTVAAYAAHTRRPVLVEDLQLDERFPKGISTQDSTATSVMCLPICLENGDLLGVLELYRTWQKAAYTQETLVMAKTIVHWMTLAIHKTEVSSGLKQQYQMSEFLLDVCRTYLDDITDVDTIIEHIMRFAKSLVSADRCTLFHYDKEKNELYSDLFDVGEEKDGKTIFSKKSEIRFPITEGVAGAAASTKQILNIPNAYVDQRFNKEFDKITGYTTTSLLCIPIMSDNEVYGVVEMINKKDGGAFTMTDQNNFKMFAVFCALALRYSKLHQWLARDQRSFNVVREQYLYHSQCPESEVEDLISKQGEDSVLAVIPRDFESFDFSLLPYDAELPLFFTHILRNILVTDDFIIPDEVIARFVLAVRNNYRDKVYHNWRHAMTVAHSMFCVLRRNMDVFSDVERLALIVASLCHDIDHRALSNHFLQTINHPLSALYPNSTMEHHHVNVTMDILHREGHDVLACLGEGGREEAVAIIKNVIISTDLAFYFGNRELVQLLLDKDQFDLYHPEHRQRAMSLIMTACDISFNAKSWETMESSVLDLYHEFWNEGNLRKELGFPIPPIMDRDLEEDLAEGQVGFLSNVTLKCYNTLKRVLPSCEELAVGAEANLERWRQEAEIVKTRKEEEKRKEEEEKEKETELEQEGLGLTLRGGMWVVEHSRT
ncbi:unnamed protein product [Clavelina lepadiformis]|uniref:Phosphodiesterase n=1 Tax=Clavelina lepadiformis TaxID=159417 RepID=A0ABP0G6B2_CLALP